VSFKRDEAGSVRGGEARRGSRFCAIGSQMLAREEGREAISYDQEDEEDGRYIGDDGATGSASKGFGEY